MEEKKDIITRLDYQCLRDWLSEPKPIVDQQTSTSLSDKELDLLINLDLDRYYHDEQYRKDRAIIIQKTRTERDPICTFGLDGYINAIKNGNDRTIYFKLDADERAKWLSQFYLKGRSLIGPDLDLTYKVVRESYYWMAYAEVGVSTWYELEPVSYDFIKKERKNGNHINTKTE